jgi:beta-galactosidase
MVIAEIPLWGAEPKVDPNNPIPKNWLTRLIENNYNHPSIIGWSAGNEIGENPLILAYSKNATKLSRLLDPSRLATVVSHTAHRWKEDMIDYSDLGLVNSYSANLEPITDKMHTLQSDKLLFYSEYGVSQTSDNLDTDFNFKALLDSIRFKPYLMGASLWTYNDYRSDYKGTRGFTESRPWGVVNDFRQRKRSWYSIRKEHSPLKTFELKSVKLGAKTSTAVLNLKPRLKLDLPAYSMRDYRVVWRTTDANGRHLSADFLSLPLIKPDDKALTKTLSWPQHSNAAMLQVELVSDLNYAVFDTTIFFSKPKSPTIIHAVGARTQGNELKAGTAVIRVVFEKSYLAQGYKIKYGKDDLKSETPVTVNSFIDIKGLNFNQKYKFQVVAINSFGESEPSEEMVVSTDFAPAPPLIKYTEPADKGIFIGYETLIDDYLFEVRYTTVKGDYTQGDSIKSTNKGVLFVPNLVNGRTYYFQVKRLLQNSNPSSWSEKVAVQPDGGMLTEAPELSGIVYKEKQALILFTPLKKAIGYILNYRVAGEKNWKEVQVSAAQVNQYRLTGLETNKRYEFRIAGINANGRSEFSDLKSSF